MKLNNMNKKYTKIQQQQIRVYNYNNNQMGFYTKIIAFVMCNVTNLSTRPKCCKSVLPDAALAVGILFVDQEFN